MCGHNSAIAELELLPLFLWDKYIKEFYTIFIQHIYAKLYIYIGY